MQELSLQYKGVTDSEKYGCIHSADVFLCNLLTIFAPKIIQFRQQNLFVHFDHTVIYIFL